MSSQNFVAKIMKNEELCQVGQNESFDGKFSEPDGVSASVRNFPGFCLEGKTATWFSNDLQQKF